MKIFYLVNKVTILCFIVFAEVLVWLFLDVDQVKLHMMVFALLQGETIDSFIYFEFFHPSIKLRFLLAVLSSVYNLFPSIITCFLERA